MRFYVAMAAVLDAVLIASVPIFHFVFSNMQRLEVWSNRSDLFGDLWGYRILFLSIHTPEFFLSKNRFAYPAPCAFFLNMLYSTGRYAHAIYMAIFIVALLTSAYYFFRMLRTFRWSATAAGFFSTFLVLSSYPWLKLYDRANLELFIYLFIALGCWAFVTGRETLAAVLWGCAGAMKIYPLLLCAVFFRKQSLRPLVVCLFTSVVVLLLAFWYLGPTMGEAALGSVRGVTSFVDKYGGGISLAHTTLDHSLLGGFKEICLLDKSTLEHPWKHLGQIYVLIIAIVGPILYFKYMRKLPVWNQLSLFLVGVVLLPPVSYDYTLIHTYLVFWIVTVAYLISVQRGQELAHAKLFYAMFALITTSQGWVQFSVFRLNGLIKASALATIFVLLMMVPLTLGKERDALVGATAES